MPDPIDRRRFLFGLGAAAVGVAGGALRLRAEVPPTPPSGEPDTSHLPPLPRGARVTEPNIEGPFYRPAAPFRGKITPPREPGEVLLIAGRVWGFDTKRPVPDAVLDIWQASAAGRYDNDDPAAPPNPGVFKNRCRLVTDETGYYEFETVRPGPYLNGDRLRPSHVHYRVAAAGYATLITQLYFRGDPHLPGDPFARPSLVIDLREVNDGNGPFATGTFNIVLARA